MNKFNAMIYGLILVGSASLLFIFIAMNILCDSSDRVQKWVGQWAPEDESEEDE